MSDEGLSEERMKKVLERAGVDPETEALGRRKWPRYETEGAVEFHRPQEKAVHTGALADISEGGLAFLTGISVAIGETLLLTYQEEGETKSAEVTVETVHSHPNEDSFLVGVKFIR